MPAAQDDDVPLLRRRVIANVMGGQILLRSAVSAAGTWPFGSFGDDAPPVLRPGTLLLLPSAASSVVASSYGDRSALVSSLNCLLAVWTDA